MRHILLFLFTMSFSMAIAQDIETDGMGIDAIIESGGRGYACVHVTNQSALDACYNGDKNAVHITLKTVLKFILKFESYGSFTK